MRKEQVGLTESVQRLEETPVDKIADSITYLAEKLSDDPWDETIACSMKKLPKAIYDSFVNDFDRNVVDGLYAISKSLDKIAEVMQGKIE